MWEKTTDAYAWTPRDGLQKGGFQCRGVINPTHTVTQPEDHVYDAIIVGGGYAGLSAARNLATSGFSVLLLEARDRIGGRSYSIELDGFVYEMGGTWVSHYQPHMFAEMRRYGLDKDLVQTRQPDHGNNYFTIEVPGVERRQTSHEEADDIVKKVWHLYINIDGENGRAICPLPFQQLGNVRVDRKEVEKWDKYTVWDRFVEVRDQLNQEEQGILLSLLLHISGGYLENSGFWDMIRSQALVGHDYANFNHVWLLYKLREGQSNLARHMFEEAFDAGLEYSFHTKVTSITQTPSGVVEVTTSSGKTLKARRAICTVPLNVLKDLTFEPPLSNIRQEAITQGHICFLTKIHADVKEKGLASWNGIRYPANLVYGYGDCVEPSGNAHLVTFGSNKGDDFVPELHPEKVVEALRSLHPMTVERTVFHNWNTDPFSQGGPCFWGPEYMSKYQDELQSRHGNMLFASADWANGWRAFIDGALEQGTEKAQTIARELRKKRPLN